MKRYKYDLLSLGMALSATAIDERHALLSGMLFLMAGVMLSVGILFWRKSIY